jgi:DNA repair protein RadA/Sms
MPRRSAQGLDSGRLALVLAVLERRVGIRFTGADVHTVASGGVRATEPGVDLALALALVSSQSDRALPDGLVACGEVGLGGELRQVHQTPRRLAEAARLGFRRAVLPVSAPPPPEGIRALRAATLEEAVDLVGLLAADLASPGSPEGGPMDVTVTPGPPAGPASRHGADPHQGRARPPLMPWSGHRAG